MNWIQKLYQFWNTLVPEPPYTGSFESLESGISFTERPYRQDVYLAFSARSWNSDSLLTDLQQEVNDTLRQIHRLEDILVRITRQVTSDPFPGQDILIEQKTSSDNEDSYKAVGVEEIEIVPR